MRTRMIQLSAAAAVLLLSAGCASSSEQTSTAGEPTSEVVQGQQQESAAPAAEETATEEALPPAEDSASPEVEETTEDEVAASADLSIDDYGFTQIPEGEYSPAGISYAVVFANAGSAIATGAQYQIAFEDESGTVLSSEEGYVTAVLPGTSVAAAGYIYDADGAEEMTVQLMPGDSEEVDGDAANFEVTNVTSTTQEYGGMKTTATVESPFTKDLENLEAVSVYRNAAGEIIGGDFTYLNFVPAGGTSAVEITGSYDGEAPSETEVFIALSGLSLLE